MGVVGSGVGERGIVVQAIDDGVAPYAVQVSFPFRDTSDDLQISFQNTLDRVREIESVTRDIGCVVSGQNTLFDGFGSFSSWCRTSRTMCLNRLEGLRDWEGATKRGRRGGIRGRSLSTRRARMLVN